MYKWGEGAACRTAQSAPRIILVTWWSNQDHLDCVKFSSSSVLGLVCVHLFEDSSCKFFHLARWSTCHGYNLVFVWLTSIWRYVRAKWLQFCPALCNAIDRSLPGSSIHFPGKNTGVGCHALLQGIFPTRGWNPRLLRLLS